MVPQRLREQGGINFEADGPGGSMGVRLKKIAFSAPQKPEREGRITSRDA